MKNVISFLLTMSFASPVFAYIKIGEKTISSTQHALKTAQKEGLGLTRNELRIKKELEALKRKNPETFQERFDEVAANPADYQSYLYEVMAGKSQVEKAKIIAQLELFRAVRQEWDMLKTTVLNETSSEDFEIFKPALVHRLSTIMFSPVKKDSSIDTSDYRFKMEDWGYVVISKDLKKINWKISVSAANDGNKLEAGADKIRTLDKNSTSEERGGINFDYADPNSNGSSEDFGDDVLY